jgi:serine/threonine-protein kinase RsbW
VTKNPLTIRLPSSPVQLTTVIDAVENWLGKQDLPEGTIADLALVVSELVNNAIEHGNKGDPEKKFTVKLVSQPGEIEILVTDEGAGFNPNDLSNPLDSENLHKPSGRGLFIVKSLVDRIRFSCPQGGGTTVIVSKWI